MSSISYSTELIPDARLRCIVLTSGITAIVVGMFVIVSMNLDGIWRLTGALIWVLFSAREVYVIAMSYKRYGRIRIDAEGQVGLLNTTGEWVAADLLSGSIVLDNFAWLRMRAAGGPHCLELVHRRSSGSEAWRRFQVIWRHLGGAP